MKSNYLSIFQLSSIVILRVVIGWYFLYEGISKLLSPAWTSYAYLMDSQGLFANLFKSLGQNHALMPIIDAINIYGLILIGLLMILGIFEKFAYIAAISLLALYYLSHPASLSAIYLLPPEGAYLWINKNIVMACAVIVLLAFPTGKRIGLARFFSRKR